MSDLIAPIQIPLTQEERERAFLNLLNDLRTELRILNTQIQITLNSPVDVDLLRQDPYYTT